MIPVSATVEFCGTRTEPSAVVLVAYGVVEVWPLR
jgi:hypothetical protein